MIAYLTERMCNLCETVKPLADFHKRSSSKIGVRSYCKECEKTYRINNAEIIKKRLKYNRKNSVKYAAYQRNYTKTIRGRASRILSGAKRRAKRDNLCFELKIELIIEKLENGKCEQTGIKFIIDENAHSLAPSLDRKDSTKGYSIDNVQMVCVAYNLGKQHMSDENYKSFIIEAAKNMLEKSV